MPKRVPSSQLQCDDGVCYHEGEAFTGISCRVGKHGRVESEGEFRDGLEWGYARTWFPSGIARTDRRIWAGLGHGLWQEWHENGQLAAKQLLELGTSLWRKRWDEQGNLVEEYRLKETDPEYEVLCAYRESYAELHPPPPDERQTDPPPRPDPP